MRRLLGATAGAGLVWFIGWLATINLEPDQPGIIFRRITGIDAMVTLFLNGTVGILVFVFLWILWPFFLKSWYD